MKTITEKLFELSDKNYAEFHSKLMPTIAKETVIGVRAPLIKKLAKNVINSAECEKFLSEVPHKYYDENLLHGAIISEIKDYDACMEKLELFLPYIDNWAVCDMTIPKALTKNKPALLEKIKLWINSGKTYTVRFAIKTLMGFYLDNDFDKSVLELVSRVKSEEYYVNMAAAWFFATALAKRYDDTVIYLQERLLSTWIHNKTISKATESYRISSEKKEYLKSLKIR